MRIAWIALAILVGAYSWAQSPERNRTSVKSPAGKSETTEKEGLPVTPTTNNPLPIILIPSPNDASHTADREKYTDQFNKDYLYSQFKVAEASEKQANASIAAAVIAGAGTLIAGFALYFLVRTYRETKISARASIRAAHAAAKAAKASQASANAAMGIARGNLILSHLDFDDMGAASPEAKLQCPKISVQFVNYGQTFAIPKVQSLEISCTDVLPNEAVYNNIVRLPFAGMALNQNQPYELAHTKRHIFSMDEIQAIKSEQKFLWVYGFILYEDFLGIQHERRFCNRLFLIGEGHTFAEDPNTPVQYTTSH